jgi:CHAD domain-containing protein
MSVDREKRPAAFLQLSRLLNKLATQPSPKNVHRFRTLGRRVEALVGEAEADPGRNTRKLLKLLSKQRKRAGDVRDLDVQISALRNLKIPQDPQGKSRLLRSLIEERVRREKKLTRSFRNQTVVQIHKRLKRAQKELSFPRGDGALAHALHIFHDVGADRSPVDEAKLHHYRIAGKRARYVAELAEKNAESRHVIQELKRLQDSIGDWHDWWKLSERAQEEFGDVTNSAVVSALRHVTRLKYRQALDTLADVRTVLSPRRTISSVKESPEPQKTAVA